MYQPVRLLLLLCQAALALREHKLIVLQPWTPMGLMGQLNPRCQQGPVPPRLRKTSAVLSSLWRPPASLGSWPHPSDPCCPVSLPLTRPLLPPTCKDPCGSRGPLVTQGTLRSSSEWHLPGPLHHEGNTSAGPGFRSGTYLGPMFLRRMALSVQQQLAACSSF